MPRSGSVTTTGTSSAFATVAALDHRPHCGDTLVALSRD